MQPITFTPQQIAQGSLEALTAGAALSPAKAPSIEQQTGWRRPGPVTICQDIGVLTAVSQYDFDLTDGGFCSYAERRGVLYKAGVGGSRRWHATADHALTFEQFCADPFFQYASEHQGSRHRYSEIELAGHWRIMRIAKGGLQDCWELYRAQVLVQQGPELIGPRFELPQEVALAHHADGLAGLLAISSAHDLGSIVAHEPVSAAGAADQQIVGLAGNAVANHAAEVFNHHLNGAALAAKEQAGDDKHLVGEHDLGGRIVAQQLTAGIACPRQPTPNVRGDEPEQLALFVLCEDAIRNRSSEALIEHVVGPLAHVIPVGLEPALDEGDLARVDLPVGNDAPEQPRQLMRALAADTPEMQSGRGCLAVSIAQRISAHSGLLSVGEKRRHIPRPQQGDQVSIGGVVVPLCAIWPAHHAALQGQGGIGLGGLHAWTSRALHDLYRVRRLLPGLAVRARVAVKHRTRVKAVAVDEFHVRPMHRPRKSVQPSVFFSHPRISTSAFAGRSVVALFTGRVST